MVKVAAMDKLLSLLAAFGEYRDTSTYPSSSLKWISRIEAISGAAIVSRNPTARLAEF